MGTTSLCSSLPTGVNGAEEVAEMMDAYNITRMDWDAIHELDQVDKKGDEDGANPVQTLTVLSLMFTAHPILAFQSFRAWKTR
jgi:hypothetical protein